MKVAVQETALAHSVIGTLLRHAVTVDGFALDEPGLDDVFFALTAAHGKEAAS